MGGVCCSAEYLSKMNSPMIIRHGDEELKLPATPASLALLNSEISRHFGFDPEDYNLLGAKL